jgi:hypothetical protein
MNTINEEIQIEYICFVNKCYPQTLNLCFEDDLPNQIFGPDSFPIYDDHLINEHDVRERENLVSIYDEF